MGKNCLIKAGTDSADALVVGRFNKEAAEKIAVPVVGAVLVLSAGYTLILTRTGSWRR
ncbi:hypothetical protein SAMN05216371_0159 [Streptomyces sp. TLI_053]|uniref:hypothetical protein n=1 Tax=Streptomyces sp. TLI_053 TaxID=1855352 RepID=UPI00087D1FDC|nr:hypothetical protein [Streptomyces sp. TLI_053]SDS55867.1 hypothetical protein SAMN05216371_0159 [Streptomyces sp. TLI_053]